MVFEAWAQALVDETGVEPGDRVLDVASGTGVVARLAARRVGQQGRVVASDVSAAMLGYAASLPTAPGAAAIERVEAPVTALPFPDGSFDAVLCQQGLPFFSDRPGAATEMRRVLRPGGVAGLSVWAAGHRLEPFEDYNEALIAAGVEPPFANAFGPSSFVMEPEEVRGLLEAAGFSTVEVSVVDRSVAWPGPEAAASGIFGTPFGPLVDALSGERREAFDADLLRRFAVADDGPVERTTTAVVARATA